MRLKKRLVAGIALFAVVWAGAAKSTSGETESGAAAQGSPPTATPGEKKPAYPAVGAIDRLDPRFDQLMPRDAVIERLAEGFKWSEGPLWIGRPTPGLHSAGSQGGCLLFSDIPENCVVKWTEGEGISLFLKPSSHTVPTIAGWLRGSNGLALDASGRLVLCQHGDRRIVRREADGRWTTLADRYGGKRFNSPNDLVFKSNGDLYFTDPTYGLPKGLDDPGRELDFCGIFRLSAADGKVTLLSREMSMPNGIGFSPDETILYVAQSDPKRTLWMAFPVNGDGTLGRGRVFGDLRGWPKTDVGGRPDGLTVDRSGNIFATGPGGVNVIAPDGTLLGRINPGQTVANCAFGDDGTVLYMTAHRCLCRIRTSTKGLRF